MSEEYEDQAIREVVKVERKFLGWLVGICTSIAVMGTISVGSLLWSLNSSVVALSTTVGSLQTSIVSIQEQLTLQSANRYTSQEASVDRSSIVRLIDSQSVRIDRMEGILRELSVFDAEVKQYMKDRQRITP
jgi:hypothetical protein